MQESLFNTVQKLQTEEKINVEELEIILNSDIEEVVALCKKACLKPKTDSNGNAFFTKEDVGILKKIKEIYAQSKQPLLEEAVQKSEIEEAPKTQNPDESLKTPKKINFLQKAKNRLRTDSAVSMNSYNSDALQIQVGMQKLEKNLIAKMSELLSEKMDGFDEIIVELIRSKTENEKLRSQVNSLNKQVYILKNEMASFQPLAFGLYTKKETEEL